MVIRSLTRLQRVGRGDVDGSWQWLKLESEGKIRWMRWSLMLTDTDIVWWYSLSVSTCCRQKVEWRSLRSSRGYNIHEYFVVSLRNTTNREVLVKLCNAQDAGKTGCSRRTCLHELLILLRRAHLNSPCIDIYSYQYSYSGIIYFIPPS